MLSKYKLRRIEKLRSQAEELWLLTEKQRKLDIEYKTLEELLRNNKDPKKVEKLSNTFIKAGRKYDNARIKFIDEYVFSRI